MNKLKVVIVDYGVGNLLSVQRATEECGVDPITSSNPNVISEADRIILPGVGAFANGMNSLESLGLVETLKEFAFSGRPLLGICLGMQLLLDESEEHGFTNGLGIIPGRVIPVPTRTSKGQPIKVPHRGWNKLHPYKEADWNKSLLNEMQPDDTVYFVHSYMASPTDLNKILANCVYGGNLIPAVISSENIIGCQFHPEKSGHTGLSFLQRFLSQ